LGWSGPYFGHQGLVDGELVDLIDGIEGSPLLIGFDLSEGPSRGASIATVLPTPSLLLLRKLFPALFVMPTCWYF
jgi:hypothetical protein